MNLAPGERARLVRRLGATEYVAVTTYAADASPLVSVVRIAPRGEFLFAWLPRNHPAAENLRRDSVLRIGASDARGRSRGTLYVATGSIVVGGAEEMTRGLFAAKYGVGHVRWTLRRDRLARRPDRVAIQIVLEPDLDEHDDSPALRD